MVNDLLTEQQVLETVRRFPAMPHEERLAAAARVREYKAAREAIGEPLFPNRERARRERYQALEALHLDGWDDYLSHLPEEQRDRVAKIATHQSGDYQRDVANRAFIEYVTGEPPGANYHGAMRRVGKALLDIDGEPDPGEFHSRAKDFLGRRRQKRETVMSAADYAQRAALAGVSRHEALSRWQQEAAGGALGETGVVHQEAGAPPDEAQQAFLQAHAEWEQRVEHLRVPMTRIYGRLVVMARGAEAREETQQPILQAADVAAEIAALPREDQDLALAMIYALAQEGGDVAKRGVGGNLWESANRFWTSVGDAAVRNLALAGTVVQGGFGDVEDPDGAFAETRQAARESRRVLEIERRLQGMIQGTINPIEPVSQGWVPKLLEEGLYSTPQTFGFTATAGIGGAGGAAAMTAYIAEENTKQLLMQHPDMDDDVAYAIGSVAAVPEMLAERWVAREFLGSFKWTRDLIGRMTKGKLAGSFPRRLAATVTGAAAVENITEGAQDVMLPAVQAYASGMNYLLGQLAPALARDVPDVDWGAELREWRDTRPEVFVAVLPLVLIGAGGAAYRDFKGGEAMIRNPEILRHAGFAESDIAEISQMEPDAAQQAIVDRWHLRDPRPTAEIASDLLQRETARRQAIALGERAEAMPGISKVEGGWQVLYPDGSATRAETFDVASQARADWMGRNMSMMAQQTVRMVEFYEQVREGRQQTMTNEFRTLQDELDRQLAADATLERGVLEERLWERVRILEEATGTVRGEDAELADYPVLGSNVLEFKGKVARGVVRLNMGATPLDVIQENAELDIKQWLAEGRVTEDTVRQWLADWERQQEDTVIRGDSRQALIEAWSEMVSSYAVARFKPEDAEPFRGFASLVQGILEKYRALLGGIVRRALLIERARAEGTLGEDFEAYLSESLGLSSQLQVERGTAREVSEMTGVDFAIRRRWDDTRDWNDTMGAHRIQPNTQIGMDRILTRRGRQISRGGEPRAEPNRGTLYGDRTAEVQDAYERAGAPLTPIGKIRKGDWVVRNGRVHQVEDLTYDGDWTVQLPSGSFRVATGGFWIPRAFKAGNTPTSEQVDRVEAEIDRLVNRADEVEAAHRKVGVDTVWAGSIKVGDWLVHRRRIRQVLGTEWAEGQWWIELDQVGTVAFPGRTAMVPRAFEAEDVPRPDRIRALEDRLPDVAGIALPNYSISLPPEELLPLPPELTGTEIEKRAGGFKRAGKRIVGAPAGFDTTAKLKALHRRLVIMTVGGEIGRFWYEESSKMILDLVGGNIDEADKIAQLVGIYSAQQQVAPNLDQAISAYLLHRGGVSRDEFLEHRFATEQKQGEAVKVLYDNAPWGGRKRNNFYNNLMVTIDPGRVQGVTADLWIMRAFKYPGTSDVPGELQYDFIEKIHTVIAEQLGWERHQVQAAIWTYVKDLWEAVYPETVIEAKKKGVPQRLPGKKDTNPEFTKLQRKNLERQFAAELKRPQYFTRTKYDFSDAAVEKAFNYSEELIPGRNSGLLPKLINAPYEVKLEFTKDLARILTNPETGRSRIGEAIGYAPLESEHQALVSPSAYINSKGELEVNPAIRVPIMAPAGRGGEGSVSIEDFSAVKDYALIHGILFKQEGVAGFRAFKKRNKRESNLIYIKSGGPITPDKIKVLLESLRGSLGDYAGNIGFFNQRDGFILVNFNLNWDAGPFIVGEDRFWSKSEASRAAKEKLGAVAKFTTDYTLANEEFHDAARVATIAALDGGVAPSEIGETDGFYEENDWEKSPGGDAFNDQLTERGKSALDQLRRDGGLLSEIDDAFRRWEEKLSVADFSIAPGDYFERLSAEVGTLLRDPVQRRAVYVEALRRLHNLRNRMRGGLDEETAEAHIDQIETDYDQEVAAVRQEREEALAALSRELEYERRAADPEERDAITERYAGRRDLVRAQAKMRIETLTEQRRADVAAARAAQRQGDLIQALSSLQAVLAVMPPEVRARVGGFVRIAKLPTIEARRKAIIDRIRRADELLELHVRRDITSQIQRILDRAKRKGKKSDPKRQTLLDPKTDRVFREILRWADLEPNDATAELRKVTAWLQNPTEPAGSEIYDRHELAFTIGNRMAGWQEMDSLALDQLHEWLAGIYEHGRGIKRMIDEARRQWVEDKRDALIADVNAIPGARPADAQTSEYSALGKIGRYLDEHLGSWQLLQATYGRGSKFVADLNARIRKATHARNDAQIGLQREMEQLFRTVFGTSRRATWQLGLAELKARRTWKVEVPQNVTRLAEGEAPDLAPAQMSDLEALYILQTWRQANYRAAREAHGWTQAMIDQMVNEMDPRVGPIDVYLARKYDEGYHELNRTYLAMFGTDMPRIRNYAPGRVLHGGEDRASDPADVAGLAGTFGAVMTRVSHANAFRQEDALSVFLSHRAQADHWRFFAPIVRDMRATMMAPTVKTAVLRRHGETTQRQVQSWISAIDQDGLRAANGVIAAKRMIDSIMSTNARVTLGYKMATLFKQANAAAASMLQIPVSEWVYSFARVLARGPNLYADILKSSTIRRRIAAGYSPEVRAGRSAWHEAPSTYFGALSNQALDAGMAPIGAVDAWFTTISAAVAYDYHYRKTGNRAYALEQMDRVVFETAQPADVANRSLVELQATGVGKLLYMFASEPRKQMAALWMAAKQFRRGEMTGAEFARVAFVTMVLMPAITTAAHSAWLAVARGADDEEAFEPERLLVSTALNTPFGGLYLVGPAADTMIRMLLDERVFDSSENILNAVAIRASRGVGKVAKGEADIDDIGRLMRELARVFSAFALPGVGYTVFDQVTDVGETLGD